MLIARKLHHYCHHKEKFINIAIMTQQWLTCGSQLQTKIILKKKKSIASFTPSYKILLSINNEKYFYNCDSYNQLQIDSRAFLLQTDFPCLFNSWNFNSNVHFTHTNFVHLFLIHTHFIHLSFSIDHTPFSESAAYSIAIHLHSSIILI